MSDLETSVTHLIDAYRRAVLDHDVEAFMQLYHPRVRVFDTWGVWSYEGAEAWRNTVHGWLSSLGTERVDVSFDDLQVLGGGPGLCAASAVFRFAATSAAGEALRSMQNRVTWVLQPEGGALKIVHEHTSAPIGFEDQKGILQRAAAP